MWWGNTAPAFDAITLLNALQQADQQSDTRVARKGSVLFPALVFTLGTLAVAACIGGGAYNVWTAWQTGEWFSFWVPTLLVVGLVLPFAIVISLSWVWALLSWVWAWLTEERTLLLSDLRDIRDALALNDDRLTPPVPVQPAPLTPGDLAAGAVCIGPLRQIPAGGTATISAAPIGLIGICVPFLFVQLLFALGNLRFLDFLLIFLNSANIPFFPCFSFVIILLCVLPITLFTLLARRQKRGKGPYGLYVMVDALGIQWQRPAPLEGEVRIPWTEVRSISRIIFNGDASAYGTYGYGASANTVGWGASTAYLLEVREAILVWAVNSLSTPEEVAASDVLLRTTITGTGKPLREMSGLATEIAQARGDVGYTVANRLPAGATSTTFTPNAPERQATGRPRIWPWLAAAVIVLLMGSLYGGASWVQSYQSTYIANLPAQIHSEKPLFHDDLTSSTGAWMEKAPDKNDYYQGFAYVNGGYQLSGNQPGYVVMATYPYQQFGDAVAYEVTATQSGPITKDSGDGVGITFNSNEAHDDFMMFTVATTGDWHIYHYKYVADGSNENWNFITGGRSDAIHKGQGVTNQLLLVVRGHYFFVYINDQFVDYYENHPYAESLPTSGYAGVYLDDSLLVGTVKNFSVYPMKPATFPNWQYA